MRPRLLLGVTEAPSVGGSSTATYDLFRRMLRDGYDAHYVTLIDQDDAAYFQFVFGGDLGNPGGLSNVRQCWLRGYLDDPHPELSELVATLDPDAAIGFGFLATLLLKNAAPTRRTVFVTGTCRQAQDYVTSGRAQDAIALGRALATGAITPRAINTGEQRAVAKCDLMVTHSALVLEMVKRFFAGSIGKVYPSVISFAEWICEGAMPWRRCARRFDERDIDVLFIASDWDRAEKNYPMVKAISEGLGDARVHIVGDVPWTLPSVTYQGFIAPREALFDLLGRARCLACPSRIDAAPGILYEGSVMGCNLVASKNCGNWELCHPELLADPFGPEAFIACIRRAMQRKYEDRMEDILQHRSYREFMALLIAISQPFEPQVVA